MHLMGCLWVFSWYSFSYIVNWCCAKHSWRFLTKNLLVEAWTPNRLLPSLLEGRAIVVIAKRLTTKIHHISGGFLPPCLSIQPKKNSIRCKNSAWPPLRPQHWTIMCLCWLFSLLESYKNKPILGKCHCHFSGITFTMRWRLFYKSHIRSISLIPSSV